MPGTKLSRNDLCHCGSGIKYKKCCLRQDEWPRSVAALSDRSSISSSKNRGPSPMQRVVPFNEAPTADINPFGWTQAKLLRPGDQVTGAGRGVSTVTSNRREEHPEGVTVYNLEIEGTHTFFVRAEGSDAEPVWVHNACVKTDGGYDIELNLKEGWTPEQIGQAISKAAALNDAALAGKLVRTTPVRGATTARTMFADAGFEVEPEMDVDHVIDLQLGGADNVANMDPLNYSVNRSFGSQIYHSTKVLPLGTVITGVRIV